MKFCPKCSLRLDKIFYYWRLIICPFCDNKISYFIDIEEELEK